MYVHALETLELLGTLETAANPKVTSRPSLQTPLGNSRMAHDGLWPRRGGELVL